MSTMLSYAYYAFGDADSVLRAERRAVPQPGRGEVLVLVRASGLNPHDTKRRSGWLGGVVPEGGIVPHADGAGEVAAVGADVANRAAGQRVMIFGAGHGRYDGTAAEYCLVPAENTVPIPDSCSYENAAALGVPAVTSCYAVLSGGPVANRWVLVHGGLGAVGRAAVEVAGWAGARVIATLGEPARAGELEALGAGYVLDRHSRQLAARVAEITGGHGADLIVDVDFGANIRLDAECLAENGRVAAYSSTSDRMPVLPYYDFALKGARLHFVQALNIPRTELERATNVIERLLAQGGLRPCVAHHYPLSEIAAGHSLLESGEARGKIVYTLD
ncbi:NADPH:quinone reductase [Aureimonas populi]|uniref:NADPH:quinone reductase n=1 Tax=Aureimonas populi TaxID=1701758 RepID=A0ABW5CRY9_9HYPH|nr:NADPH:quinone reductase [Aureimonas populi]